MTNSLLINDLEMCIGNGSPYALATGPDFGTITPDTTTVSSLLLDGDQVTGERTPNKTWQIGILVTGSSRADLSTKVDTLLSAVKVPPPGVFPVIWTPDGGSPANYSATLVSANVAKVGIQNAGGTATVQLTFQTGPFGQSADAQGVYVPATGGPTQMQLDNMDSGSFSSASLTTTCFEGTHAAAITLTRRSQNTTSGLGYYYNSPAAPGRNIPGGAVDTTGYFNVSIRFRWNPPYPSDSSGNISHTYHVTFSLALTDSHGATQLATTAPFAWTTGTTSWKLITFRLSTFSAIDLTSVNAWAASMFTSADWFGTDAVTPPASSSTMQVDDLRIYPAASAGNATGEGQVITIPGVLGSARTPLGLQLDIGGTAFTDAVIHRPPVTQDPDLTILAGLASGAVSIPAQNSNYDGTYVVVVALSAWHGSSRTVTATFTQTIGGTTIGGPTAVALTTASAAFLLVLGEIQLPLTATPPENQSDALAIAISGGSGDVATDVMLLDTSGQTIIAVGMPAGNEAMWIDTPGPAVGIGQVYGAATIDRTQAYSVMPGIKAYSGGPMLVEPGDNRLLVASAFGAPNVTATYFPRWLDEALL